MRIHTLLAQINPCVGDIQANMKSIEAIIHQHTHMDLIIFPELALCGYPPEDLLCYPEFHQEVHAALLKISKIPTPSTIILGTIHQGFNAAAHIHHHQIQYYYKKNLPNYGVFDKKRYFQAGKKRPYHFEIKKHRFGLMICEDIWSLCDLSDLELDTLITINASPYEQNKFQKRLDVIQSISKQSIHTIYVNQVGGQDALVFDGQSMVINPNQEIVARAKAFSPQLLEITYQAHQWTGEIAPNMPPLAEIYQALCLGLKDFMHKNGFQKAVLGLSGGIDSALTLAIACDAIGAENVHAILMPSPFTSPMSIDDAKMQATTLGITYEVISIEPHMQSFQQSFKNMSQLTYQNLQARIRGVILMAYSNEHQALLLNTSNKSESAVGYGTLYGDMCGGYAVLQDVYKTQVYQLAEYRNTQTMVIPKRVITRAPSAELAPYQTDQDDLPPYEILDAMLIDIIEHRCTQQELHQKYETEMVDKILKKIKQSEFKRFQAPPGCKVTSVAFGKDWRFPLSQRWKI